MPANRLVAIALISCVFFSFFGCVSNTSQPEEIITPLSDYSGSWILKSIDRDTLAQPIRYLFSGGHILLYADSSVVIFEVDRNRDTVHVTRVINEDSVSVEGAMLQATNTIVRQSDTLHIYSASHHVRLVRPLRLGSGDPDWYDLNWQVIACTEPRIKIPFALDGGTMVYALQNVIFDVSIYNEIDEYSILSGPVLNPEAQVSFDVPYGDVTATQNGDTLHLTFKDSEPFISLEGEGAITFTAVRSN